MQISVPAETTACALGADAVAAALQEQLQRLGATAQVIRTGSRGAFFLEPLVEVVDGGQRLGFGPVSAAQVPELLNSADMPSREHPLCIGDPDQHPWLAAQTRLTFARVGKLRPLDYAAYADTNGLTALRTALAMSADEVIDAVTASGLRGRGGAAFPAGIKWRTVADQAATQKYIVCNADEGDSGTFADRLLMECDPFQLLEAMAIAGIAVGADKGYIYLRSEYPRAHEVLLQALSIARSEGMLGTNILGSDHNFDVELRLGAGAYICGEETALLESIEGKRGVVRKKPPLPAIEGLFSQPTLVHNVLTLAAVTTVLQHGAKFYAGLGQGRSTGTMPFQLGGNVARGGLVEVPFGIPLGDLLNQYGGGTYTGRPLEAVQAGGPLGAYLTAKDFHLPLEYETLAEAGAMLGHGGIVVFDDSVDMAAQAEFAMRFCAEESCGKCTPCRVGSVKGVALLQALRREGDRDGRHAQRLTALDELLETMELGSLCAMGGLTPMPVRSILERYPNVFAASSDTAEGSRT
jgi:formate dehydrogenase iron-sulfur subunit